ncbi:hypothetical protein E4U43_006646, partial [Claviceps pusilla]
NTAVEPPPAPVGGVIDQHVWPSSPARRADGFAQASRHHRDGKSSSTFGHHSTARV